MQGGELKACCLRGSPKQNTLARLLFDFGILEPFGVVPDLE